MTNIKIWISLHEILFKISRKLSYFWSKLIDMVLDFEKNYFQEFLSILRACTLKILNICWNFQIFKNFLWLCVFPMKKTRKTIFYWFLRGVNKPPQGIVGKRQNQNSKQLHKFPYWFSKIKKVFVIKLIFYYFKLLKMIQVHNWWA